VGGRSLVWVSNLICLLPVTVDDEDGVAGVDQDRGMKTARLGVVSGACGCDDGVVFGLTGWWSSGRGLGLLRFG
jgi:hypothetical protein